MACGAPVIATRTGAIPEYADGAALLVDPGDRDALRDALIRMLSRTIAAIASSARADRSARGRTAGIASAALMTQLFDRGGAMRIGIDARKIADFGIGTYIRGLLQRARRGDGDTYVAFAPQRLAHLLPAGVEHVSRRRAALLHPRARRRRARGRSRQARSLPRAALRRAVHARADRRDDPRPHPPPHIRNPLARLYARQMIGRAVRTEPARADGERGGEARDRDDVRLRATITSWSRRTASMRRSPPSGPARARGATSSTSATTSRTRTSMRWSRRFRTIDGALARPRRRRRSSDSRHASASIVTGFVDDARAGGALPRRDRAGDAEPRGRIRTAGARGDGLRLAR